MEEVQEEGRNIAVDGQGTNKTGVGLREMVCGSYQCQPSPPADILALYKYEH